jgi:CheY-like chemotaxis protein
VKIESAEGDGTTVLIYLPRYLGEAAPPDALATSGEVQRGSPDEIVMVVEDEERVRHYSAEALRELGYTVLQAATGAEALQRIQAGQAVTLLFTDIVMPGMTGRELTLMARRSLPGLKVLYTTGYSSDADFPHTAGVPGTELLQKPFTVEQLGRKVRDLLDG